MRHIQIYTQTHTYEHTHVYALVLSQAIPSIATDLGTSGRRLRRFYFRPLFFLFPFLPSAFLALLFISFPLPLTQCEEECNRASSIIRHSPRITTFLLTNV